MSNKICGDRMFKDLSQTPRVLISASVFLCDKPFQKNIPNFLQHTFNLLMNHILSHSFFTPKYEQPCEKGKKPFYLSLSHTTQALLKTNKKNDSQTSQFPLTYLKVFFYITKISINTINYKISYYNNVHANDLIQIEYS